MYDYGYANAYCIIMDGSLLATNLWLCLTLTLSVTIVVVSLKFKEVI